MSFKLFSIHNILQHARSLAAYLPSSRPFVAKDSPDSNLHQLLLGFGGSLARAEKNIHDLFYEKDITKTTMLIEEWERAVGIPDDIFTTAYPIEKRRLHVLIKLTASVQTTEDFEELGRLLGYADIKILPLIYPNYLPWNVPFIPWNGYDGRFVAIVTGTGILANNPPYDVPFDVRTDSSLIIKLFEKLKPAHTKFLYFERLD